MEQTTVLAPVWKFVVEDIDQKELADIHLIIWISGVCIACFDEQQEPVIVQTYMTDEIPGRKFITRLANEDALLKKYYRKVNRIWLCEERNLIVPNEIYEKSQAEGWLRKFHFLAADEGLQHFKLNESVGARIIFPISEVLKACFLESFPNAVFSALSDLTFQKDGQADDIYINMVSLPREVLLSLVYKGRFIYHGVCPYENTESIIYKIALVLQEKGIEQKKLKEIRFSGIAPFWNNILTELPGFFPVFNSNKDTTEITLVFVKKLKS